MVTQLMYAISSSVFAAIFLASIIIYGDDVSRALAITAAFFGCYSQFVAQDTRAYILSICMAYVSLIIGIGALVLFFIESFQ